MGDILTINKKAKRKPYRLWNTVVDRWVSPPMNTIEALDFLINYEYEPHTYEQARDRITRRKYKKDHMKWLHKFFDTQIERLNRLDKRNGRQNEAKKRK